MSGFYVFMLGWTSACAFILVCVSVIRLRRARKDQATQDYYERMGNYGR